MESSEQAVADQLPYNGGWGTFTDISGDVFHLRFDGPTSGFRIALWTEDGEKFQYRLSRFSEVKSECGGFGRYGTVAEAQAVADTIAAHRAGNS